MKVVIWHSVMRQYSSKGISIGTHMLELSRRSWWRTVLHHNHAKQYALPSAVVMELSNSIKPMAL